MTPTPLVETVGLSKEFPLPRTVAETFHHRRARAVHAVDGVSLSIQPGETLGLIGESGSGKTTFGWLLARLYDATAGEIRFEGESVHDLVGAPLRRWRGNVQVVFQDPVGSLDPRMKVWQIVAEPVRVQERLRHGGRLSREELRARVRATLPQVGLPPDCLDQYAHEFSGGGRQRISLARAFSVDPRLVILDEPTSALDVSVQAQILNRLVELQRERGLAYLLITHNVAAVRFVADRVAVMYLGQVVEVGDVRGVLDAPLHPYTKALIAALPRTDPGRRHARYRITGDIPTLIDPEPGCRFAPRCPFVQDRCRAADPPLRVAPGAPSRLVACVRAEEVGAIPPAALLEEGSVPPQPPDGEANPGDGAATALS